jgi:hypothetical protein
VSQNEIEKIQSRKKKKTDKLLGILEKTEIFQYKQIHTMTEI